ncbi:MAG: metallophosphoesterase family protein [Ruegeria sp.]|uniref:metallophosphoesterase family protein n=1 Tax=Ruegeria sp. TaxID=1879320 RepID=UPI00349EA8A8
MFSELFKRLAGGTPQTSSEDPYPPIAPDHRFYAVGDIHGRLDLLEELLTQLDPDYPLVFVGDYIDRGENSAGVLRRLRILARDERRQVICLLGNHEEMLLRFVDDPKRVGRLWLQNGGLQTFASFGVTDVTEVTSGDGAVAAAESLSAAMGEDLLDWLRTRPLTWQCGNVIVAHAAMDPTVSVAEQDRRVLLWGRPALGEHRRQDGFWLVHGHTIVPEPCLQDGLISIDTGAFVTGQLTAAEISRGRVRFITTGGSSTEYHKNN